MPNPTLTPEDVADAYALAASRHRTQTDKQGAPYIHHLVEVARSVRDRGAVFEIVGVLHDSIEDTETTEDELRQRFGDAVADAVVAMSKRDGEDYAADYLPRVVANPIARVVKRADAGHNLSRCEGLGDPAQRARLEAKYTAVLAQLADG